MKPSMIISAAGSKKIGGTLNIASGGPISPHISTWPVDRVSGRAGDGCSRPDRGCHERRSTADQFPHHRSLCCADARQRRPYAEVRWSGGRTGANYAAPMRLRARLCHRARRDEPGVGTDIHLMGRLWRSPSRHPHLHQLDRLPITPAGFDPLAMRTHGVDLSPWPGGPVSAAHGPAALDIAVAAFRASLDDLRARRDRRILDSPHPHPRRALLLGERLDHRGLPRRRGADHRPGHAGDAGVSPPFAFRWGAVVFVGPMRAAGRGDEMLKPRLTNALAKPIDETAPVAEALSRIASIRMA